MSTVKSEHVAPGENSVIRLVVMESGTRLVYWKDKLLGSIGDDDSLVATLEAVVDHTWDKAWDKSHESTKEAFVELFSKPEVIAQLKLATIGEILRDARPSANKRKKFLGIF